MSTAFTPPRQLYQAWVEEQIEEYKSALTRDELLDLAEQAVSDLFTTPDGQYPLTEILLCDAVDTLLFRRLNLPDYKHWLKACRSDTSLRPGLVTPEVIRAAG
ncbi:MAG TPA: hypothetical protein VF021_01415 [Longimicrobiales bacterium]